MDAVLSHEHYYLFFWFCNFTHSPLICSFQHVALDRSARCHFFLVQYRCSFYRSRTSESGDNRKFFGIAVAGNTVGTYTRNECTRISKYA